MSRTLVILAAIAFAAASQAQQLRTYTESETGPAFLTYGLPVPRPIDSLLPVEGFRSYASLQARLQALALESPDLAAHDVGRTIAGRTVWAYVASDEDEVDVEGRPEAAFFINASTHAREWATPEVSIATLERLVARSAEGGVVRYVLDNARVIVLPVHNIDGVLQTQRYPTQVLVGQDPDVPSEWPRDGRMRRKNMRGVDEMLTTTADHLLGVDLNRNHPPFWASSPSSSTNPASLTYHGAGPHSEPENQALLAAAHLGPESRLRLGIDLHTYGQVFFSSNTGRARLNAIQDALITRMNGWQGVISDKSYAHARDPLNVGIGAAAEYFARQWLVPAWTLEIEPSQSAFEYGATDVTHGGFILPASQARRVRDGWAQAHLYAFYRMAGPPHLERVRVIDARSGELVHEASWRYDAASGRRVHTVRQAGAVVPGRTYAVHLGFNKPMRVPANNTGGLFAAPPGTSDFRVFGFPSVALVRNGVRTSVRTNSTFQPAGMRYAGDSYAFYWEPPPAAGDYTLEVDWVDASGQALDADPATPADWSAGAWSHYENGAGVDGDTGGVDATQRLTIAAADAPQPTLRIIAQGEGGEGDRALLSFAPEGSGPLELLRTDVTPAQVVARWAAGESDTRVIAVALPDNVQVDGDRELVLSLAGVVNGSVGPARAYVLRVLDNDTPERRAWRVTTAAQLPDAWAALASLPAGTTGDLVVDENLQAEVSQLAPVSGALEVHGNGSRWSVPAAAASRRLFEVTPSGRLTLDRVRLDVAPATVSDAGGAMLLNAGSATLTRCEFTVPQTTLVPLVRNTGELTIERSGLRALVSAAGRATIENADGHLALRDSTLAAANAAYTQTGTLLELAGGQARAEHATLGGLRIVPDNAARTLALRHSLVQELGLGSGSPPSRVHCTRATLVGEGGNVFTADYPLGDEALFGSSGCFTAAPSDLFDAAAYVPFQSGDPTRVLAPPPADWRAADRILEACRALDQRGAPRPQGAGCEAGAHEIGFAPQRGIWSPARAGHGLDLQMVGNQLVMAWYTYDDDGSPTAYQAVAPLVGTHWDATLQRSRRDVVSGRVIASDVGRVTLDFTSATQATLGWRFDARGITGSEALRASVFASGEPRLDVTGLWYPPAESGQGLSIARLGAVTAFGVYYYDAAGNVRWALGTGDDRDAQGVPMRSFRGFCPDCDAAAMPVTSDTAGYATVHFLSPRRARVDLMLTPTLGDAQRGTWVRENLAFVPLNDPR